jgi:hypothetical protein
MAYTVPSVEPEVAQAGLTWAWTKSLAEFPPSESWTLVYHFRGASALDVTATSTPSDPHYTVTVPATSTAALTAGRYRWSAWAGKSGEYYEAAYGVLVVEPNHATAAAGALQTHAEQTLAVIEAALAGRLTSDLESYTIAGRSVSKIPVLDLAQLRGIYAAIVWRERHPDQFAVDVEAQFWGAT